MNALGQLPGALWQAAVGFSGDTRPLRIQSFAPVASAPPLAYDEGERLAIMGA